MFDKLIYLASPYSHPDTNVITRRVLEVQDATARLIEAGHLIFSPIVHSHNILSSLSNPDEAATNFDFWRDYDLKMIDKCDELWILRLDGHTRSKGVHAELYHALDRGIPVKYINYPDLSTYAAVEACTVAPDGLPDVWDAADFRKINTWGKPFPTGPAYKAGDTVRIIKNMYRHEFEIGSTVSLLEMTGSTPSDNKEWKAGQGGDYWYIRENEIEPVLGPVDQADGFGDISGIPLSTWLAPDPKPLIIGLTGHAQSGKDTAGKYLVEKHGFTRIGLADAVKECLYALDPEFRSDILETVMWTVKEHVDGYGWESTKGYPTVREYLQRMGTEVGRNIISPTVWLDIAERKIKELGPNAKVVITDIRFPNEAEWVRALGGQVVRINREGFGPVNDHASDARLDDALVDAELQNDFTLENLYLQLETRVLPYAAV